MKAALAKAGAAFIFCSELAGHFGTLGRRKAFLATINWQNLINWLLRIYDVDSGEIRIDGQNITKVMQVRLRSAIWRGTQNASLLHRSIRDNIACGQPDATDAQRRSAAASALADELKGPTLRNSVNQVGKLPRREEILWIHSPYSKHLLLAESRHRIVLCF